jgi:predicted branched-subunit amino acid permease
MTEAEPAGQRGAGVRAGIRAALPLVVPTLAIGASFGIVASPLLGGVATIVMSAIVFAGSAQLAALSSLAAGAGPGAAVVAGLLMNARFLSMGFAIGPSMRARPLTRAAQGQAIVDGSWAMSNLGGGRFDIGLLIGSTIPQWICWTGGTALGVVAGNAISDPAAFGLDTVFPAFYLALLAGELRHRRALVAALAGAAITLALMPAVPPGLPIIAASAGALVGLWRPA